MSPVGKRSLVLLHTVLPTIIRALAEAETDSQLIWAIDSLRLLGKHAGELMTNEADAEEQSREMNALLARLSDLR